MDFNWIILYIVGLYLFGCVMLYFSFFMMSVLDDISIAIYGRPIYIHFYLFPKTITEQEESILKQQFQFYNNLNVKDKKYFRHRLAKFKKAYEFIPKEDFK